MSADPRIMDVALLSIQVPDSYFKIQIKYIHIIHKYINNKTDLPLSTSLGQRLDVIKAFYYL